MIEEYTLKLDDTGKTLEVNGENPNDQTEIVIPDHSTTPFPIGTQIKVYRGNEKKVTLRGETSNLKLNSSSKAAQNNFSFFIPKFTETQIRKRALNEWHVNAKGVPLTFAEGGNEIFVIEQNGILYRVHVFQEVGESEFEVIGNAGEVEYLVVGGGGGGSGGISGDYWGSGGGGGEVLLNNITINASAKFNVFVGSGGLSATTADEAGENGEQSTFFSITASGGQGGQGGSGGSSGNGNPGGVGTSTSSPNRGGGGGGGDSQPGFNGRGCGGNGGNGTFVDWANIAKMGDKGYFGGGGGGWNGDSNCPGVGGLGGGATPTSSTQFPDNGMPNTGGGASERTGKGGSGIVIVRYEIAQPS